MKPVPAKIQLLPNAPYVVGRDNRTWFYDVDDVLTNTIELRQDLPIDIEHSTELKGTIGEPAPAVGWVKGLFKSNNSIWADIEWLEKGIDLISSGAYRYVSPIIHTVNGEIKRIVSVALTNQPNLYLPALNRSTYNMSENNVDLTLFVPRADYDIAINRAIKAEGLIVEMKQQEQEKVIDALISDAVKNGIVAPATVEYHKAQCRTEGGIQRFKEFLSVAPPVIPNVILNKPTQITDEERQLCRVLGISIENFLKTKGEHV